MKNIFQNQSIKKAAAAGMIAAQVSIGSNFLSDSFVDNAFAESGFYNAYNISIFDNLVPNYSASSLDVSQVENTQDVFQRTKCVFDSELTYDLNPVAYSVDIMEKKSLKLGKMVANGLDISVGTSSNGLYPGLATTTYNDGPNYNTNVAINFNLTSSDPGAITTTTNFPGGGIDMYNYTPSVTNLNYATGTYTATDGQGGLASGVFVYNKFSPGTNVAQIVNTNKNTTNPAYIFPGSNIINVNPSNGNIFPESSYYYYLPNTGYVGQDYFSIGDNDYYVSVNDTSSTNITGFAGGNLEISEGDNAYYKTLTPASPISFLGHNLYYISKAFYNILGFFGEVSLYNLVAPTTTFQLPQFNTNNLPESSAEFVISTAARYYKDDYYPNPFTPKESFFDFSKEFYLKVEHKNKAPITLPVVSSTYLTLNSTGTVDILADYSDLEIDQFELTYEISNDLFDTVYASTTKLIVPVSRSTSTDTVSFTNLPLGDYQVRTKAVESLGTLINCLVLFDDGNYERASSTSVTKNFTVSNAPAPINLAPIATPTSPTNFVIDGPTGNISLSSEYLDFEGDDFDLLYEIYEASSSEFISSEIFDIDNIVSNSTSSHSTSNFTLPLGTYIYRLIAEDFAPTKNGGLPASSTSAFRQFTVSNLPVTPPIVIPLAPVSPQGGLLPLTLISPEPTLVASNTAPTTTEIKIPVKEVLGLNPEDSDDLLPGETPAAYLIRMEKRRVLGKSGSRNLVNTGSNVTSSLYVGAILLSSAALLFVENRVRRNKGEVKD